MQLSPAFDEAEEIEKKSPELAIPKYQAIISAGLKLGFSSFRVCGHVSKTMNFEERLVDNTCR